MQSGKLTPNLDKESTKILNLTVLQRIDPNIEEILITAAHVTFYEFNIQLSEWSRKDVEGSLFVVKRNTQPRFQFIVLNRRNTDNLVENLLEDFEYEIQIPYLLYRNSAQEVIGIWFFNSRECEEVANLFSRILSAYSKVSPKPKVPSSKSELEELKTVPTMAAMEGPLESSPPTVSTVSDVPADSSLVSLFNGAMNIGNASKAAMPEQHLRSPTPIPLSYHAPSVKSSPMQIPSAPLPTSSAPLLPLLETPRTSSNSNRVTNLVKPSVFSAPSSSALLMPSMSSSVVTTPIHPHPHPHPFRQPFPPPSPPPSHTPSPTSPSDSGIVINRDKVRHALLRLVQDNQFIDMFCQELLNVTTI